MTLRNETGEFITLILGKCYNELFTEYEVHIQAEVGFIKAELDTYTWLSALEELYEKLSQANRSVSGHVFMEQFSFEHDTDLRITYDGLGHAVVTANLRVNGEFDTKCTLSFATDQSYITAFLSELKREANI